MGDCMRNKSLFYKLIKCGLCNGNYKKVNYRGKNVYICSRKSNYGTCERIPIPESFLIEVVEMHYQKSISEINVSQLINHILIMDRWNIEITFTDGSERALIKGNFIKY